MADTEEMKNTNETQTVLPTVRVQNNENVAVHAKTQTNEDRAAAMSDKEKALAVGFMEYASFQNKEKNDAYVQRMEAVVRDYMKQGLTPDQMKGKIADVLDLASSVGVQQGISKEALDTLRTQAKEGMDKLFSQVAPAREGQESVLSSVRQPQRLHEAAQQPDLHPVRVQNNENTAVHVQPKSNENEDRAAALSDKEKALAIGFMEYASFQNKEKNDAYVQRMKAVVRDYMNQGLTPDQMKDKIASVLDMASLVGAQQGISKEALDTLRAQAKEGMDKLFSQVDPVREGNQTSLNANAPVNAESREAESREAESQEAESREAQPETEKPEQEQTAAMGVAQDVENAQTQQQETVNQQSETPAQTEQQPQVEENIGSLGGISEESGRTQPRQQDLMLQVQDVQMKNAYFDAEASREDPPRDSPFSAITHIEKSPKGVNPPYVAMQVGVDSVKPWMATTMYNRPNSVDIVYSTSRNPDGSKSSSLTFEACMDAVRLGMEKGWTATRLSGPKELQEKMYLACCAMGLEVKDYFPSEELKRQGEILAAEHKATREHCADIDGRFPEMEKIRTGMGLSYDQVNSDAFMDKLQENNLGRGQTPEVPNRDDVQQSATDNRQEYAEDLKKMTGVDWEYKAANESGLGVNNLRTPLTPEIQEKLDKEGVKYEIAEKDGQKLAFVDTNQPLMKTAEEKAADARKAEIEKIAKPFGEDQKKQAEDLKKMTGVDWEYKAANESGLGVNNLRTPLTPEIQEKLDKEGVKYEIAEKDGQKLAFVDTDQPSVKMLKEQEKDAAANDVTPQQQEQHNLPAVRSAESAENQQAKAQKLLEASVVQRMTAENTSLAVIGKGEQKTQREVAEAAKKETALVVLNANKTYGNAPGAIANIVKRTGENIVTTKLIEASTAKRQRNNQLVVARTMDDKKKGR